MGAGQYRHRVTVQRPTGTLSTTGGLTAGTPATIATNLPASIAPQDARVAAQLEGLGAGGVVNTITHVVGIRYRADVRVSDEVLFGARTFEIVRVLNPEERNRELQLLCVEKVN